MHLKKLMINFINKNFLTILFFFVLFIYAATLEKLFLYNYKDSYAFSELFLNYQGGFVRRGFLGEVFMTFHKNFNTSPIIFFSSILFVIHILNSFLLSRLIIKANLPIEIAVIIFFSPALILFPIYDFNMFFVKDAFVKFLILMHAFVIIQNRNNLEKYIFYLKFIILPLIFFTTLFIHEYELLFIPIHLLFSLYVFKFKKKSLYLIYGALALFLFLIITKFIGNENVLKEINSSISLFEVTVHQQLSGGFVSLLGGFYKWHFFYFGYKDFFMLFSSFLLSVWVFYFFFQSLIVKEILIYKFKFNYLLFFIPSLLIFLNLDHGRNLSLLSFHLVAFFLVLKVDASKLIQFIKYLRGNFFLINCVYIFLFFYIFMWVLPQDAGFGGREQVNTIFKSSLLAEVLSFVKSSYIFINNHIITLPEIKL